jgi:SAM-dependent methyltransferase
MGDLVDDIRTWEVSLIARHFPHGAHILEIGAGRGQQALEISRLGFTLEAIDIPSSLYARNRVFPITDYDGRTIPFANNSFDVVFSSSVLEHVPDISRIHAEIRRVLKPGGRAVHVVPTHLWRIWTTLSAFPAAMPGLHQAFRDLAAPGGGLRRMLSRGRGVACQLVAPLRQGRHGERGNILTETWYFHPRWWRKNFRDAGFCVEQEAPMGLFYTGYTSMGAKWDIQKRARLASRLGSVCRLFVLSPRKGI